MLSKWNVRIGLLIDAALGVVAGVLGGFVIDCISLGGHDGFMPLTTWLSWSFDGLLPGSIRWGIAGMLVSLALGFRRALEKSNA